VIRTVYILPAKTAGSNGDSPKPTPVQIKTGISDGTATEVVDGLEEGAQVVTGMLTPTATTAGTPPPNPFGGGFRRF
jgi:hypothetical protein